MDTYLIQVINNNNKAFRLLQDLEALNIIRVLKKTESAEKPTEKKSTVPSFRGALKLSEEEYNDFQKHATEIRNEWPEKF